MRTVALLLFVVSLLTACKSDDTDKYVPREPVYQGKSVKRGVSFSFQFEEDVLALSPGTSWSYNWGPSQNISYQAVMTEHEIDFCPMAWNGIDEVVLAEYLQRNPACEYLLAFNEPNLTDQANMTPSQAAERWPAIKEVAQKYKLKIISPAMNYGTLSGYHDPIVWLDEFFTLIPIEDIEGIAIHCYMPSASALKSYVERFKKYGKPIWLTEFCAWDGHVTPDSQRKYLSEAFNYLENDPDILRYAWFIPRSGGGHDRFPYMSLLKNSYPVELTELGMIYNQMSAFDKSIFYVEQQQIEAEHYSDICITESIGKAGWTNGPALRLTSDAPSETLELYNFLNGQWVDYQIQVDRDKTYELHIRYATFIDTDLEIYSDGELKGSATLINTSQDYVWNTAIIPVKLNKGQQTLRLKVADGKTCINWLRFL
ncbi:glycosyl hydrolase [Carboxylicivirga sp. RSCT41]|uniref:glycosyl hydrolase n=1 Tax=Carboxylicivirga agarovorans TaxID=3417570 RepID=UPI003D332587